MNKIRMILFLSLTILAHATMHTMERDVKTAIEQIKHSDDKTKADKNKKNAAKVAPALEHNGSIDMELFDHLPIDLKVKVVQCYDKAVPNYVLRHKRELAPLIFDLPLADARDILDFVDHDIADVKKRINSVLSSPPLDSLDPESLIDLSNNRNRPLVWSYRTDEHREVKQRLFPISIDEIMPHGAMNIAGYADRTYSICFWNPAQSRLINLMDSYSLEQNTFFVSLAKIPVSKSIASIPLSSKDCAVFASLDVQMQTKLKRLYWWIDFYTPKDSTLSIDEKIQWAQNKIIAHAVYWLQWAKRLPYFCKKDKNILIICYTHTFIK